MNINHEQLKAFLVLRVKKLGPASIALKLDKFLIFDGFFKFLLLDFPDLDNFWDLAKFLLFNFSDFLACFTLLPPNSSTSPLPLFYPKVSLLLLFFLEADLLPLFLLKAGSSGNLVVFNIKVNRIVILLKPWMNH